MEKKNDEHVCCLEDSCYKLSGLISPLDCVSAGGRIKKSSDQPDRRSKLFVHTLSATQVAHGV